MAIRSAEEFRKEQERRKQEHYQRGRVRPEVLTRAVPTWPTTSTHVTQCSHEEHIAIDIGGSIGNPIFAVKAGTITDIRNQPGGYGLNIRMIASDGMELLYGHLSGVNVKVGQKVKAGQVIGALGNTGKSTGPHLHFEVRDPSRPETYLPGHRSSTSAIDPMSYLGLAPNVITNVLQSVAPTLFTAVPTNGTSPVIKAAKGVAKTAHRAEGWSLFEIEIPLFEVIQGTFFPSEEQKAMMKEKGIATFPVSMLTGGIGIVLVLIALWQISAPQREKLADLGMEAAQIAKAAAAT